MTSRAPNLGKLGEEQAVQRPMRLLLADDDRGTRLLLNRMVASWGFEVIEAADGDLAWSILKEEDPPQIAILDWIMPGLDGIEICQRLADRRDGAMVYVLLLTMKNAREDTIMGLDSGAHDFLSKPVDFGELKSRVAVGRRLVEADNELRRALAQIKTLRALLPICSTCKKIRADEGYWQRVEEYLYEHAGVLFSHSICPECKDELFLELDRLEAAKGD
jgi:phosphoserine phosphatase RsbU/P